MAVQEKAHISNISSRINFVNLFFSVFMLKILWTQTKGVFMKFLKKVVLADRKASVEKAVDKALDAFWDVVANEFPDAKTGDFPPDLHFEMQETMTKMVNHWLQVNLKEGEI